jgi:hypothetical protein
MIEIINILPPILFVWEQIVLWWFFYTFLPFYLNYLSPDSAMDISKTLFITFAFSTIFLCFLCKKADAARECEGIIGYISASAKKWELLKTQERMIEDHFENTI